VGIPDPAGTIGKRFCLAQIDFPGYESHPSEFAVYRCDGNKIGLSGREIERSTAGFALDCMRWPIGRLVRNGDIDLTWDQVDERIFTLDQIEQGFFVKGDIDAIIGHTHKAFGPWPDEIDPGMGRGRIGFDLGVIASDGGPAAGHQQRDCDQQTRSEQNRNVLCFH